MSIEEKRRAAFEAWWLGSGMTKFKDTAEAAWNAALDSVVIDLSVDLLDSSPDAEKQNEGICLGIDFAADKIKSAGLRVRS